MGAQTQHLFLVTALPWECGSRGTVTLEASAKGAFAGLVWPPRGCLAEIGAEWRLRGVFVDHKEETSSLRALQ